MATSYSEKTAIWFHKPTLLNQPLFQMPVLGYVSGSQGILLFGAGLPVLFGVMNAYDLATALAPFSVVVALAVIRPPVLGYEGRLAAALWFHAGRRRNTRRTARRAGALEIPARHGSSPPRQATPRNAAPGPPEPIRVRSRGRPVEVSLALRTRENRPVRENVRILLDGSSVKTAVPSESGEVSIVLHPEDCVGTREISVHGIKPDDSTGGKLAWKEVAFE